jgi:3-hydroxyisobutyrate dehydrogenase-like beta-hydroxyacid dehydrogenase
MAEPLRVGFIGVGLMGHGAAGNILAKGYPLTILGHVRREPVEDLVRRGATEATTPAEVAVRSDIVFTCLPSSLEVEAAVFGADGLLDAMRAGTIHVDATTADPASTRRIGAAYAEKGVGFVDAPMGRTPREAEAGRSSSFVAGDPDAVARAKPVIAAYADTIIEAGPLGSGHTMKLVNNFISIGTSAVIAEAFATARALGIDLRILSEVISSGGANSAMFQMMKPCILDGDDSHLRGPLRIAAKDLRTYCGLAAGAPVPPHVAQAVNELYRRVLSQGHDEAFIPRLPELLLRMAGRV